MTTDNIVKNDIIDILLSDSRLSFRAIAKKLKISTTTVSKIVKELEDSGIILGYTTILDWEKLGYDSTLCLQISVNNNAEINKVGAALRNIPELKQVLYTTGDTTFSVYAVCKDTKMVTQLIEQLRSIPGIEKVVPHTVLKVF